MDPKKVAAEWFRTTVFRDEALRPQAPPNTERLPAVLRAARSLENGKHQNWQSREAVFMKQGKLLAGYEDDYDYHGSVTRYYPTYHSLTDRQLRGYFSWRTKLRHGDLRETSLSFAFLYIYELINQIGVIDPIDGYRRLVNFRDAYGPLDSGILPYLNRWRRDYVIYYNLDPALLTSSNWEQKITVLEHIREEGPERIMDAVNSLSRSYLDRSRFYKTSREDMDMVTVHVLRRMSDHYAARCKKTMTEQYFGICGWGQTRPFDGAVFCDPLKRRDYEYSVNGRCVCRCQNGVWSVWTRSHPSSPNNMLGALLKTIDSMMREAYGDCRPIKAEIGTKWIVKIIEEEIQALLAQKKAAEEKKVTIDYGQLTRIRQDAAVTQEKLIVDEETDRLEELALPEPAQPAPAPEQMELSLFSGSGSAGEAPELPDNTPLSFAEYRLLRSLLYGGDTGWVQAEGHLLSMLVDGINEKLYDTFLDTVIDDGSQLIEDYIADLKEMVHP